MLPPANKKRKFSPAGWNWGLYPPYIVSKNSPFVKRSRQLAPYYWSKINSCQHIYVGGNLVYHCASPATLLLSLFWTSTYANPFFNINNLPPPAYSPPLQSTLPPPFSSSSQPSVPASRPLPVRRSLHTVASIQPAAPRQSASQRPHGRYASSTVANSDSTGTSLGSDDTVERSKLHPPGRFYACPCLAQNI